jgi:hypothetical protein
MNSYCQKLSSQAAATLEPGEAIVAATRCLPKGRSTRRAAGGVLGTVGILVASTMGGSGQSAGGIALPTTIALGLSAHRLLVFHLNDATERVSKLTHTIPLADVWGASVGTGRKFGVRITYLDIALSDGSHLALEAASPHAKEGEAFGRALAGAITPYALARSRAS